MGPWSGSASDSAQRMAPEASRMPTWAVALQSGDDSDDKVWIRNRSRRPVGRGRRTAKAPDAPPSGLYARTGNVGCGTSPVTGRARTALYAQAGPT